jgi:hypothetical protein
VFAYYDVTSQPAVVTIAPTGEATTRYGAVEPEQLDELVTDAVGSA